MAAPFVSGAAALLLSLHPLWNRQQVVAQLAATAAPLDLLNPEFVDELGAGELNAAAAVAPNPSPGGAGTDSGRIFERPAYTSLPRPAAQRLLRPAAPRGASARRSSRRF